VAFFHRASRTLLVTDCVISVPQAPPEVVPQAALEDAGKDSFFVRLLYPENDETAAKKRRARQAAAVDSSGDEAAMLRRLGARLSV
jgi:Domain of unknown function (DUF4336)